MRLLYIGKDGGKESPVTGYWLLEIKSLFSIVLLKFNDGGREAYHSHAFTALTWFLKGSLIEERMINNEVVYTPYTKSLIPKITKRDNIHRVKSHGVSWCLSLRGPWTKTWLEYDENSKQYSLLTKHRQVLNSNYKGE